MINYSEIIEQLEDDKIIQLMESLGVDRYKETDSAIIFPTICHNIDSSEASLKLYYYKNSHMFQCYSEDGSMSIFKFLKIYYETRQIEYDWYNDILQVVLNCSASKNISNHILNYKSKKNEYTPKKNRQELQTYNNGLLDLFVEYYPIEWLNDGITIAAMKKFNIRFSITQNKIIIPHYNYNGDLVGIRGRALNEWEIENIGKYAPVWIENKCYSHPLSLNLYGLNLNYHNIQTTGIAYIVESEKSVMQADNFKLPNCTVASCGSNLNKFQIDLLIRYCHPREIVVCYDQEERKGNTLYFEKLYKMCLKYKNYCKMSFIYDQEGILPLKASPTDLGEEVFIKLLKKRIVIN